MRLPDVIEIGPHAFKVVEWDALTASEQEKFGEFCPQKLEIRVKAVGPQSLIVETMLHEIGHAIWFTLGLEDGDSQERVVRAMGAGWAQVWLRNPDFSRYVCEMVGHTRGRDG